MRERERGAGCFIGCDLKQDGGSLRRIKEREELRMHRQVMMSLSFPKRKKQKNLEVCF